MQPSRTYTVVGAGGIGCAVGYCLCAAGLPVRFVDSDPAKIAWGRSHGVCLDQLPPRPAEFVCFEDWSPQQDDRVVLATKCYDNPAVLARLAAGTTVVPIQNGFDPCFDSRGEFAEGIASFVSECISQRTQTRITRKGLLHLGIHRTSKNGMRSMRAVEVIAELAPALTRAGLIPIEVVADILPFKHTKLMYNAAIGPLAAAAGLDNGRLLSVPRVRKLFFALLRENYSILQGAGVPLGKIGPFHPHTVHRLLRNQSVAWALSWAFYPTLRGTYCSMHPDLPKGRTEIEYYNRYLIDLAGNRPCPLNRGIYELIKSMERDRITPGLEAIECLPAPAGFGAENRPTVCTSSLSARS
jgi:2-dehydropantoate 2-reductase